MTAEELAGEIFTNHVVYSNYMEHDKEAFVKNVVPMIQTAFDEVKTPPQPITASFSKR